MRPVVDQIATGPGVARLADRPRARDLLLRLGEGFVPARSKGVRATVEWRIEAAGVLERFQMQIDDGRWRVVRGGREPSVTLTLHLEDLAHLVAGNVEATELFLKQRLTASGDFLLAVRMPHFFGLTPRPAAATERDRPAAAMPAR